MFSVQKGGVPSSDFVDHNCSPEVAMEDRRNTSLAGGHADKWSWQHPSEIAGGGPGPTAR